MPNSPRLSAPPFRLTPAERSVFPSETMLHLLFVSYARSLAKKSGKRLIVYAPTQNQEATKAYDAGLMRGGTAYELYLQFKRTTKAKGGLGFRVDKPDQLDTLKKDHLPGWVYYVTGRFLDIDCALKAQEDGWTDPAILDMFSAVSAHDISIPPGKGSTTVPIGNGSCDPPTFGSFVDLLGPKRTPLLPGMPLQGFDLLDRFINGDGQAGVGCMVQPIIPRIRRVSRSLEGQGPNFRDFFNNRFETFPKFTGLTIFRLLF